MGVVLCMCVCVGHRSVECPRGLALQSSGAFQKRGAKTPLTNVFMHTDTHGPKEKVLDMTKSPWVECLRLICGVMSLF